MFRNGIAGVTFFAIAASLIANAAVDSAVAQRSSSGSKDSPARAGDRSAQQGRSIRDEAWRGAPLRINFLAKACQQKNLFDLVCNSRYDAQYNAGSNAWKITGYAKSVGKTLTNEFKNAPAEKGSISIWGILGKFDEAGKLSIDGVAVGTISIAK